MIPFVTLLLFCHALLVWSGNADSKCPTSDVRVRLPPTFPAPCDPQWLEPPPGWNFGNWKITYSTQPEFLQVFNAQVDKSPIFPSDPSLPPDRRNQLDSFQTANSSTIITTYLIDTPSPVDPASAYNFVGVGALAALNGSYSTLAWGYGTDGVGYDLEYNAASNANGGVSALNILSRIENGPSEETFQLLVSGVLSLGNAELAGLAQGLTKLPNDGRRTGLPPVACPEACVNNTDVAGQM
jgi:hypothetical protein